MEKRYICGTKNISYMKRILLIITLVLTAFMLASCTPSSKDGDDVIETVDEVYYVKYASNGLEGTYSASYTTEDGNTIRLSNLKGQDFERTIGPVTKGFKASYSIMSTLNYTTVAVRIEVKKGNGPFVVKKEDVKTSSGYACSCGTSYTIE